MDKGNAMKNLSLKLEDDIFQETEKIVTKVKKNRNRYINEAIEFYNRLHRRRLLSKQLSKESKIAFTELQVRLISLCNSPLMMFNTTV